MSEVLLKVENLAAWYGETQALERIDLAVHTGEVVGLLGRNGAGKTTLLEAALGLRELDAGRAELFGCRSGALDDATRARIGYVPQQSDLFEWMSADQLMRYFSAFYPRWNQPRVDGLIQRWGIDGQQRIGQLSVGQQQRVSIIRALAHEPELLVLDEPVASLDPAGRRDFLQELIGQVTLSCTAVVFSTHILSDLERVAADVALLEGGRLALQAPLDDLLDEARRVRGRAVTVQAWLQAQRLPTLASVPLASGQLQVVTRMPAGVALPAGLEAEALNLEDLFLAMTET